MKFHVPEFTAADKRISFPVEGDYSVPLSALFIMGATFLYCCPKKLLLCLTFLIHGAKVYWFLIERKFGHNALLLRRSELNFGHNYAASHFHKTDVH